MLRTSRAAALSTLVWLVPAAASADPDRASVESRLQGYEHAFSGADLAALGPGADRVLSTIAEDTQAHAMLRARATSALGHARTPAARAALERLLKQKGDSSRDRLLVRKAAVAIGWQGLPDAVSLLAPLVKHPDEEVRIDAAIGLGLLRAPAALDVLRQRLAVETSGPARFQIEKQIRLGEDALREPPEGGRPAGAQKPKR